MYDGMIGIFLKASIETVWMVGVSGLLAVLFGLPLGMILFFIHPQQGRGASVCYRLLSVIVNMLRSVPFIILMIAILPVTRALLGTSIGTGAAVVPLTVGAIPFFARLIESGLLALPRGLWQLGLVLGAQTWQMMRRIFWPELRGAFWRAVTLTLITLVGYSAMAGTVGGGGLGDLAIRYGYERFQLDVMLATVVVLVLMVQLIQWLGDRLARQAESGARGRLSRYWWGVLVLAVLAWCFWPTASQPALQVGVMAGPEAIVMKTAVQVAEKRYNLRVQLRVFSDYNLPNAALADGSLDVNVFQHLPFLQAQNKARDYDLVSIGKTFVFPMGLYSKKINKISDCPDAAVVAIPSDPTNEGRALLLLQASQLIRLRSGVKFSALPQDVVYNPKHIKLIELDAAQLPRSLADVTLAAINTNFAVPAGLLPKRDALFLEKNDSPYANIVVVRRRDRADPRLAQWLAALQSPQVVAKAAAVFSAAAIPAFKLTASDRSAG